ncbi:acyl-CoA dehydrogenase [Streptomyces pilosus]|uniref:acyl-CoA dehydrogenase family protein n=1 Tax=Streptomyces pilosus TaxID=28893 RepID=UPI001676A3DA|nr:acyl-CoA dehydrogenase [Streptomyces pilosus]GGV45957.1 acyl-CoA dehydrogenase [Streptomyces pilosus]
MRFAVAEQDATLAEATADVLAKQAGTEEIRAGWPGGVTERVDTVWRTLADVGVTAALVPEGDGGLGLDANTLPPLMEVLGHHGLPVPAAETVAVGAPLLAAAGSTHLADVLGGTALLTASFTEGAPVPFATRADLLVLRSGDRLLLYSRDEVSVEPLDSVDGSRALGRVTVSHGRGQPLAEDPDTVASHWRRGVLATAGLLVGIASRMVETTVGYVRERQQFGVPVGSFQAVKHALADAELAVRFARPAVLAAGWAEANGAREAAPRTSMAKALASEAARRAAGTALQCHGAIGYTTEYDLHLHAKRAWALAADWGGPTEHRALIARWLGLTATQSPAVTAATTAEGAAT